MKDTKQDLITAAEWEVMRILWSQSPLRSRQIIDRLLAIHDWKEGTVKTLLHRLVDKGMIRRLQDQKPFLYSPCVSELEANTDKVKHLFAHLCNQEEGQVLARAIDIAHLSQDDCQNLIKVLHQKAATAPKSVSCTCLPGQCRCHHHHKHQPTKESSHLKMKEEKSCGALVYHKNQSQRLYLLIQHANGGHWAFTKGHVENQEKEEETALREIKEEVNLDVTLDTQFRQVNRYQVNDYTFKDVIYFVAESKTTEINKQDNELLDYAWLNYSEALARLTYPNDQAILQAAESYLNQK